MRTAWGRACVMVLSLTAAAFLSESAARAQDAPESENAPASSAASSPLMKGSLKSKVFRDLPFYEPLRAEPHAARIQLLIPAWADEFPDSIEPGSRFAWQITLGREIPIVAVSTQVADGKMEPGEWGIGLWTPVSFHMIEDFKDPSSPIVDTDYRFGAMVKFQYGLSETLRLGLRYVPWAHESTHLGDEYTIFATTHHPDSFERVNVSYEYQQYGISFEGSDLFKEGDDWVARHGGLIPWGPDGYYSDHTLESEVPNLTPSHKNYEPSFGIQYSMPEWRGRQTYLSFDLRDKLIYNYHQTPDNPEQREWSWNLQIGRAAQANSRSALKSYFLQFYRGVNPYGQLRSQSGFWSIGVGWVFGL